MEKGNDSSYEESEHGGDVFDKLLWPNGKSRRKDLIQDVDQGSRSEDDSEESEDDSQSENTAESVSSEDEDSEVESDTESKDEELDPESALSAGEDTNKGLSDKGSRAKRITHDTSQNNV